MQLCGAASGSWVRPLRWPLASQLVSPAASSVYVLTVLLIESESFSELTRRGLEGSRDKRGWLRAGNESAGGPR